MTGETGKIKTGRIMRGVGGFYYVEVDGALFECRARGKFRLERITPLVGDFTEFEAVGENTGYLRTILPRKNRFLRPPIANLDLLVITASDAPPATDPFLIDRLLTVAIHKGIEPLLVFNKVDIQEADKLASIYKTTGIPFLMGSAATGEGREGILSRLGGKLSAFAGNSGVGKSSILNSLSPELSLKTGGINEKIGRGRHTTRHVEILKLPGDALVADTPGFSSFDLTPEDACEAKELAATFPEFRPFLHDCRFVGCSHRTEDGCAVLEAVSEGKIHKSRHDSYLKLYEMLSAFAPWERKGKR